MLSVMLYLGFATLVVRFGRIMGKTESNIDRTTQYVTEAQKTLLELDRLARAKG